MKLNEYLSRIPSELHTAPWLKSMLGLLQGQIQVIQKQAEQIVALKTTVQELKDEIARLTKTPKRPKFRAGGGNSRDRSGAPNKSTGGISSNANKMTPQKI